MLGFQNKVISIIRSPQFFIAILILFVLESVWIALSAVYPMVFDENVHFTIIKLYSHQWGPFFPSNATYIDPAGAVTRDPSFLYHYLMSFPYRLISYFTANQMLQVIALRLINIALFGSALVLFRRLLLKTKVSPALVNIVLLFFILIPTIPLLAGQINYDNLIEPLAAIVLLLTMSISDSLNNDHDLPIGNFLILLTLCMLGSLVQIEFLAIFVAIFLWLGWQLTCFIRTTKSINLKSQVTRSWQDTSSLRKIVIGVSLVVSLTLFLHMYGINLARYHTPLPACNQVLSDKQCSLDANWVRAQTALAHKKHVNIDPIVYAGSWTYRMFISLFYTSSGGAGPKANFLSINPLPIIFVTALSTFIVGVLLALRYGRQILNKYPYLGLLLFVSIFYYLMVWLHVYSNYIQLGIKVGINGRYLLPLALPFMLFIALAYKQALTGHNKIKLGLLIIVFLLFLQGGGALTYINDSHSNWYWHNRAIVDMNHLAQDVVSPLIIIKTPLHSVG